MQIRFRVRTSGTVGVVAVSIWFRVRAWLVCGVAQLPRAAMVVFAFMGCSLQCVVASGCGYTVRGIKVSDELYGPWWMSGLLVGVRDAWLMDNVSACR